MKLPPFQSFVDAHRAAVYRFLVAAVGHSDADDCFQETFIAAMRGYPRFDGRSDGRAWVMKIAHNKAIDAHRRVARRPTPIDPLPDRATRDVRESDPELWAAVWTLPSKQRTAVLLRYGADLGYRDIARALGSSEQAARKSASDGIKALRKRWNDE